MALLARDAQRAESNFKSAITQHKYHSDTSTMAYDVKPDNYFHGERKDFVDPLSMRKLRFLEIGCGKGATARYARSTGRVDRYIGVELFASAADKAKSAMDKVIVGDVERIDLPSEFAPYDVVIMSEVLEHLIDPWSVIRRIRPLLSPTADVFASSPSVSHLSVIKMLINGRWDLTDFGRMDRTHLRWFTPSSYAAMFTECGFFVYSVENMTTLSRKQQIAKQFTPKRYKHLFTGQMKLHARPA